MAPIAALQLGLVGRAHLDAGTAERIEAIEQHGAYMHLLFKLRRPSMVAACGSVPCTRRCRPQVGGAQKASFTRCDDGRGSTPHVR